MPKAKSNRTSHIKHGHCSRGKTSPEYRAWEHIIQRITNPKCKCFANYGGRGLGLAPSWRSFESFFRDMGRRPTPQHSIERRDNNKGYFPDNCYWATLNEQARNKRNNHWVTFNGRTQHLSAWATETGIGSGTLHYRITRGWSLERAFSAPIDKSKVRSR